MDGPHLNGAQGTAMPQERWRDRKFMRAALGCVLGAILIVAGVASAAAGDDEEEDNLPDAQMLRGLLKGMGLKRGDDTIEYRERSPLVVPPSRDLPPPESDVAVKNSNAAWPVDQDEKRRKAAVAVKRKVSSIDESRALRPNEMMPNGTDAKAKTAPTAISSDPPDGAPIKPSGLGFNGWTLNSLFGSKPETGTFSSEPPRASLTEPPVGYRTPAPNQPYGLSKDKAQSVQSYDFWNKHGTE
jgi:hypothetical protein